MEFPGAYPFPNREDCGDVELETDGALPAESLQCLTDASGAGDVASLAWVRRTTEGDPTPYFVQTDGAGATVASTAAYDTYGQGGWREYGRPHSGSHERSDLNTV